MAEDIVCFKGDDLQAICFYLKLCVWRRGVVVKSLLMITVFQQRKLVFIFVKIYWQKARPRRLTV